MATSPPNKKGLEIALNRVKKDWGEEAVATCDRDVVYKAIPTGHDDLDRVLTKNAHGMYLGGIIELFGSEGSGKCVVRDTFCQTPRGLLTVEEIFEENGLACDATAGFVEKQQILLNGEGSHEKTSHFYRNHYGNTNLKTIRITTRDGFHIEGTYNHPVRVLDENGHFVWRKLEKLRIGDAICIMRGAKHWNESDDLQAEEASLVGLFIGDGNFTTSNRIGFTNSDPEVVGLFKECLRKCYPIAESAVKQDGIDYHINNVEFVREFKGKHGIGNTKSPDKVIPKSIRVANCLAQKAFIRAYFDTDGTFDYEKDVLQFSSASLSLLQQLQLILLNFGIFGRILTSHNKTYDRDYFDLELAGAEVDDYNECIGFNANAKTDKIVAHLLGGSRKRNTNVDTIPHQCANLRSLYESISPELRNRNAWQVFSDVCQDRCQLTYARLRNILEFCKTIGHQHVLIDYFWTLMKRSYIYSPVKQIEHSSQRTFDFTLPGSHSFWSNGIISHNTSLAFDAVAQAQRLGYPCVWIDAEYGFSTDLALIHGVDPDMLIKPKLVLMDAKKSSSEISFLNAKKILDLAYDYIVTNQMAFIVVDSVAGLMPERLADSGKYDPEKAGVGEVANAMAEGLKRCVAACMHFETSLILINQLRDQPGKMYQDPFHTPGGRSIKFYARHRLSVEKIKSAEGQIKHFVTETGREELVGHWARVKIVKNKVAPPVPPELQIDIPIYYREYNPDNAQRCYELARKLQVIKIRNDILTWKDGERELYNDVGEAACLHFIREQQLESLLASQCVEAAKSERNKSLKQPIVVPKVIEDLAVLSPAGPILSVAGEAEKARTKRQVKGKKPDVAPPSS
jgi:RecA/RadA recombinase